MLLLLLLPVEAALPLPRSPAGSRFFSFPLPRFADSKKEEGVSGRDSRGSERAREKEIVHVADGGGG